MKLVEILAKELEDWPEGVCVCQDSNGECYSWTDMPEWDVSQWVVTETAHVAKRVFDPTELADDYQTVIVTKEMWEAEKAKLNVQNTSIEAESFDPIYCRDRIKEIDALVESLEEERVSLVQALEDEGFVLVSTAPVSAAPDEVMSDPSNWEEGDLIECINGGSGVYTKGSLYTFIEVSGWGSIRCIDDTGRENGLLPECFEWHSRPQQ